VGRPAIVLADEPTGNLDSAAGASIVELLRELNRGGTTIAVITHNQEVAAAARRRGPCRRSSNGTGAGFACCIPGAWWDGRPRPGPRSMR